jgi:5-formyltetrahydrofolate cyclo-ligase
VDEKQALRDRLREARREHVASIPDKVRALLFHRPPHALAPLIPDGASIGLYRATSREAPAGHYASFFHEAGHPVALPFFHHRDAPMEFRRVRDPLADEELQPGPHGIPQLPPDADVVRPDLLFVPLVGFTADGYRLGQGGGHYDRWLAANPGVPAIGLAWDCQLVDSLPLEPHDHPLAAVVTPTRLYGPF